MGYKIAPVFGERDVWAILENGRVVARVFDEDFGKSIVTLLNQAIQEKARNDIPSHTF